MKKLIDVITIEIIITGTLITTIIIIIKSKNTKPIENYY
jgi:hypothetical protein